MRYYQLREPTGRATACQRLGLAAGVGAALALLGACAAVPPAPDAALDAARTAIANAERTDAGRYAGADLSEARQKLALAIDATSSEEMLLAERLANESRVGAELALARTEAAKANAVNQEMNRGAVALDEEMQRAGDQR